MDCSDLLALENEALRDLVSRLGEANRGINESLDFDTVLQGVLDSARSLTGSRYGVITLLGDSGRPEESLSSGMTAEEAQRIWDTPDGMRIFEYVGSLSEPLRIPDLLGRLKSLGLPGVQPPAEVGPAMSFLVAPVLHRGARVGYIFAAEKEGGGEFTAQDQETLALFASQAALVISNSRRYRDEQRARADLETLINISPVGVAVFDASTGVPVSFNREARRIADRLLNPGEPVERLLETLVVRRSDGWQASLGELSLVQLLSDGETLRAEELVLSVPDGRSVSVLVNVTPMRSEDGEVRSAAVTVQDMTPLGELERLRAEFLGMVSHELRGPLTSIKGSVTTLLAPPAPLNATEMRQFHSIIDGQIDRMHLLISDLLDVARIDAGELVVSPEPTDVATLTGEARREFTSRGARQSVHIKLAEDLPWVMADRMRLIQVLSNLLSNAARHSPEASVIRVSAEQVGVHVAVSVHDEGRGIAAENLPLLFRKFSRIDAEDQGGDTGLGLAICKGIVEAHGGRIWAESEGRGLGARFTFTLPAVEESAISNAGRRSRSRRSGRARTRVLAVDDDLQSLRYIREVLTRAGYHPVVTANPDDVLRLLEEEQPQLALLDLVLPGGDGIELMQRILATTDVPVIFVSAYGQEENVTRALDLGAVDYVVKPFSASELTARIRAALRQRAGLVAGGAAPALLAGGPGHRLRPAAGDRGRQSGGAHRHRVRRALRAFGPRRGGGDPPAVAGAGLGRGPLRGFGAAAHHRQEAARQAGRRRRQPPLHLHRAAGRLPDANGRRSGNGGVLNHG